MYSVALLIERKLEQIDADQVIALHEGLSEPVSYHVLLPIETSAAIMSASLSSLGGGEIIPVTSGDDLAEVSAEIKRLGQDELDASVNLLRERGVNVTGQLTEEDPVDALLELVNDADAAEAIILTEPHVIAEFFHVDWTSRARRRLDVPTLHLLEHLPFSAQG